MFLLAANKQNWVLIEEAKTIFIKVSNIFFWGGGGGEEEIKYCALSDCLLCFFTITAEILAHSFANF